MKTPTDLQRRKLLKYAVMGIAGAATYPSWAQTGGFVRVNAPSADFLPDVELELTMNTADVAVLKGEKTRVWKVTGKVINGSANVLDNNEGTYLATNLDALKKARKSGLSLIIIYRHSLFCTGMVCMCLPTWTAIRCMRLIGDKPMFMSSRY